MTEQSNMNCGGDTRRHKGELVMVTTTQCSTADGMKTKII